MHTLNVPTRRTRNLLHLNTTDSTSPSASQASRSSCQILVSVGADAFLRWVRESKAFGGVALGVAVTVVGGSDATPAVALCLGIGGGFRAAFPGGAAGRLGGCARGFGWGQQCHGPLTGAKDEENRLRLCSGFWRRCWACLCLCGRNAGSGDSGGCGSLRRCAERRHGGWLLVDDAVCLLVPSGLGGGSVRCGYASGEHDCFFSRLGWMVDGVDDIAGVRVFAEVQHVSM